MLSNAKARARLQGVPFDLTLDDIHIPDRCPVFGTPIKTARGKVSCPNSPSLDRIVPELGYIRGNVVIVSFRANRAKSDLSIDELSRLAHFYQKLTEEEDADS